MGDEQYDAVAAAEQILSDEYSKARAEECPQGDECPVHFRVDEVMFDEPSQYARLITYVGEFAVVTEDNPDLGNPALLVKAVLGSITREELPPRWSTMVIHVGEEGVLGDSAHKSLEERRKAFRYHSPHDVWDDITASHEVTVSMLEAGLLDVSLPWKWEN